MDQKLSDLQALPDFQDEDLFYVVRGGVSYKIPGHLLQKPEFDAIRDMVVGGLSGGAPVYADTDAGLADTSEGDYFNVPSPEPNEIYIVYRHDAGPVATELGRTPSTLKDRPFRLLTQYADPGYAEGNIPELRAGQAELVPVDEPYLESIGAVNGVRISVGTGSDSLLVREPIPTGMQGKYAAMSCFAYADDEVFPSNGRGFFIEADGSTLIPAEDYQHVQINEKVMMVLTYGQIPSNAAYFGIGVASFAGMDDPGRYITGVNWFVSDVSIEKGAVLYDVLYPVFNPNKGISDVQASIDALSADVDALSLEFNGNVIGFGDLDGGAENPAIRSGSPIVELTDQSELIERGYTHALQWRTDGNEFVMWDSDGVDLRGQRFYGYYLFWAEDDSDLAGPTVFQDESGSLTGVAETENGTIQLSDKLWICWASAAIQDNSVPVTGVLLGKNPGPAGECYSTGFFLTLDDYGNEFNANSILSRIAQRNVGKRLLQEYGDAPTVTPQQKTALLSLKGAGFPSTGQTPSYVEAVRDGHTIRRTFFPFPTTDTLTRSSVFNFWEDYVDGVMVRRGGDDAAPYRVFGTTLGANHGYFMTQLTAAGHGKTSADIGSVYSDGTDEHVILGVPSSDLLYITNRVGNGLVPTGTLTHVSGGTNTGDITGTDAANDQFYPPFNNRRFQTVVDGVEVSQDTVDLRYRDTVVFRESYDLLDKSDIVEWYVSTGGAGLVADAPAQITVSISYEFDIDANCTVYTDFLALEDGVALNDIMFLQAAPLSDGVDGPVNYYIPKSLPVTHEGETYDYANIDTNDTTGWSDRLDFTPARCEPDGILCDRLIMLNESVGFALGYLPVQSTAVAERRLQATEKALQISTTQKIYMSAIDKGSTTLSAGEYYSTIGYRNLLIRDAARTCAYPVRTRGADYLYVDWHASGLDRVPVPADYAGRDFTVVEKSDNVGVLSEALTNSLVVDVDSSESYGYLIIRVD